MSNRLSAFALAVATSALVLSPALASAADDPDRRASVAYTDLDLPTEEGLEELDRRIDFAAEYVCYYNEHQVGTRIRSAEARSCYEAAKRSFEQQFAAIIEDANYGG